MAVEMLIKASVKEIAGLILEFQGQPENPSQLYRQVSKMLEGFLKKSGESVQDIRFCTENRLFVLSRKEGRTMITVTVPDAGMRDGGRPASGPGGI